MRRTLTLDFLFDEERTRDGPHWSGRLLANGAMRVSLPRSDLSFGVAPGQTLLDAALGASLNLPHRCKSGNCGSCRARLLQGEIYYPNGAPLGLSAAEAAQGLVLLCQARARTDLCIETFAVTSPEQAVIQRLPARIEQAARLAHDVMGLHLRLPAAVEFRFEAGQHIDVMLSSGGRRSYSIASPPHDARLLELHVRRIEGGEFSAPLFEADRRGSLLDIEGPLGRFAYRPGDAPMLLVGGGTGLAPLLSMVRHVADNGIPRRMTLYWGVRSERDLYAEDILARAARLHYVPVLSEPTPAWRGARGLVHEAVLRDGVDLEECDVYAAGPPAMIAAVRSEFARRGVAAERLLSDSFD